MAANILIKDSVRYRLWDYDKDEVNKFEPVVVEHIKDILGDGCEYFPKRKLKTLADNRSIPDGFVIDFKNQKWYVVELKLLCDDAVKRIAGQIVNYKNAVKNPETRRNIYKSIKSIKDAGFLDDLINDEEPEIVIIIDTLDGKVGGQFKEQIEGTKIIEFKAFRGEDDSSVFAYLFNPLESLHYPDTAVVGNSSTTRKPSIEGYDNVVKSIKNGEPKLPLDEENIILELLNRIHSLDPTIKLRDINYGITCLKGTKRFAALESNTRHEAKEGIVCVNILKFNNLKDPRKIVKEYLSEDKEWDNCWRMYFGINSTKDVDYAMSLIKQAYDYISKSS